MVNVSQSPTAGTGEQPPPSAWRKALRELLDQPGILLLIYPLWLISQRAAAPLNLEILTLAAAYLAGRRWGLRAAPVLCVLGLPFVLHLSNPINGSLSSGNISVLFTLYLVFRLGADPGLVTSLSLRHWRLRDWALLLALCLSGSLSITAFEFPFQDSDEIEAGHYALSATWDPGRSLLPVLMVVLGLARAPARPVLLCILLGFALAMVAAPFWPVPYSFARYLDLYPGLWPVSALQLTLLFTGARLIAAQPPWRIEILFRWFAILAILGIELSLSKPGLFDGVVTFNNRIISPLIGPGLLALMGFATVLARPFGGLRPAQTWWRDPSLPLFYACLVLIVLSALPRIDQLLTLSSARPDLFLAGLSAPVELLSIPPVLSLRAGLSLTGALGALYSCATALVLAELMRRYAWSTPDHIPAPPFERQARLRRGTLVATFGTVPSLFAICAAAFSLMYLASANMLAEEAKEEVIVEINTVPASDTLSPGLSPEIAQSGVPAQAPTAPALSALTPWRIDPGGLDFALQPYPGATTYFDGSAIPGGQVLVQVGAYASWQDADAAYLKMLSAIPYDGPAFMSDVTSGGREFVRLRLGPFPSVSEARFFCTALSDMDQDCIPVTTRSPEAAK